jgi:hypothetical protein
MKDYKEKYLKYKSKYLNLKNIIGGADEIFTIYTTGIAYGDISKFWDQNKILDNTLRLIPKRYNKIIINHTEIDKNFNSTELIASDMRSSTLTRNIVSTYTPIAFDFSSIEEHKSYLIYDFAHLYRYINENHVGYYALESESGKKNRLELVSIYFAFAGSLNKNDNKSILVKYIVQKTDFFTVKEDGTVITFVNTLKIGLKDEFNKLEKRYNRIIEDPLEIIIILGNELKNKFFQSEKNKDGELINNKNIRISVMTQLFDLCMEGKSYNEIIKILTNKYNPLIKNNSIILPESCNKTFTIYTTGTAGIPLDFWMAEN